MGEQIEPGRGAALVAVLEARDGQPTILVLDEGREVIALNCAWGRDFGEDWEHVTLNASPEAPGLPIDLIDASEVDLALAPDTREVLYRRTVI